MNVRRLGPSLLSSWFVVASIFLVGCGDQQEQTPAAAAPPPAVTVMTVRPTEITPGAQFNGRVVAIDKVDLRARVTGFLEQREFTEGSDVQTGDLLFVIEQAPFEADVAGADAQVARAQASLAEARATLARIQEAIKSGAVSATELDQATAQEERAQADVLAAQAELQTAELNLGYTEIRAPVGGRIGRSLYTVGNLVGPDSGVLATIVSQDPIYVTFPVSQRQLLEYRRKGDDAAGPPVVKITLPDGTAYEHPGKVNFFDVQVDQGTDTVTVRAAFPNPERTLVDGQFVNVRVERGEPVQMLAVPQASVQIDQAGPFVLVVGGDDKVEARRITLGAVAGAQVVVQAGLKAGDKVIVEGIQKARPGITVAATEAPPAVPTPGQGAAMPAARDLQAPAQAGEHGTPGTEPASGQPPAARDEQAPAQAGEPGAATSEATDGQAPAAQPESPQVEPGKAPNAGEQAPAAQDASPPLAGATDAANETAGGQAPAAPNAPALPQAKPGGVAGEPAPPSAQ